MIQPLEGAERYRVQDVAAKMNEVIATVNGLVNGLQGTEPAAQEAARAVDAVARELRRAQAAKP